MERNQASAAATESIPECTGIRLQTGSEAADQLIRDLISPNTRRAYTGALKRLDEWRSDQPVNDALVAEYLGHLDQLGRVPASAQVVVAAVRFISKLAGISDPLGPLSTRARAVVPSRSNLSCRSRNTESRPHSLK